MYLKQTKTRNGRIYLSITDGYYDKAKKLPALLLWNLLDT